MPGPTRRRFLEEGLLAAAAAIVVPSVLPIGCATVKAPRKPGPWRVAVIGVRGRGRAHINGFKSEPDAEVTVICDPDEGVIEGAQQAVPGARYVKDLREVMEDPDVDIVTVATPNHWHALAAVWALDAGKHVYVEKPLSHDLGEGRALVDAAARAAKHGIVLQHGTQARSQPATIDAMDFLHSGGLGEVRLARGLCYKRRTTIGQVDGDQQPPATCDYDLWTGPAELHPLRRKNMHYDWHWDFNTGNGDIGNQGIHQLDIAAWGLGVQGFPDRVAAAGGRVGYVDDGDTFNSQVAAYAWGDKRMVFETRGLETPAFKGARIGVVFHCEKGYLVSAAYDKVTAFGLDEQPIQTFAGSASHYRTFLDAVNAGDPGAVTAGAMHGHVSAGLAHLANTANKLGADTALRAIERPFGDDEHGNTSWERMAAHLSDEGVGGDATIKVSPWLPFDPTTERFGGEHGAAADTLANRTPRTPYDWGVFA